MPVSSIDPELVHLLVCPACRGNLTLVTLPEKPDAHYLHCAPCTLAYPVREGIPVMLTEEAVSTVQTVVTPVTE